MILVIAHDCGYGVLPVGADWPCDHAPNRPAFAVDELRCRYLLELEMQWLKIRPAKFADTLDLDNALGAASTYVAVELV